MKIKFIVLIVGAFAFFISCQQANQTENSKKGMTKVTILYENGKDKTFDMNYYSETHMPLVASLLGDSLKEIAIDKGMAGRTAEEPIPYLAIGYLYFDSLADYQNSFGPNAAEIVGDIPNFTIIQPILQISEVIE
jgi:uncharacterized protein (TIGR02118 family)